MKVLVAAWVGSTNLGDELVFAGLRRQLAALGAEVGVISVSPEATAGVYGVEAVGHRDVAAQARALREADALVLGGGGLVQDHTSVWNLPYHLSRVWGARLAGRPVGVVGIGAGPLVGRLGRPLARASLASVVVCTARDAVSAELLQSLGVGPVRVAADLALSLPVPEVSVEDRLVVALRPWTGRRGILPAGMGRTGRSVDDWFVPEMARALDQAAGASGLEVRFVAFQADRDGTVHERVAEAMSTTATTVCPGVDEVVDEVARGRVVVAMRYHALVAAVLGARPAVALGYDLKVASLAADAGAEVLSLPWSRSVVADLPGAVMEATRGDGRGVAEARERLKVREQANGAALEHLLAHDR